MDQIIAEIKKIPPVTRFICGSSLTITVGVILRLLNPYLVFFESRLVFRQFQIWRLYTSFFLGGGGLNYIFELLMLYNVTNELENKSYFLRSSDMAYQLMFVMPSIIAATWPLKPALFTRPLLLALVYLYSRLAPPSSTTSIMGLVTVPIRYYPYILIAFDLIIAGPGVAAQSVAGAAVGHVWWWSVWGGELGSQGRLNMQARAPEWLRKFMGESGPRVQPPAAGGEAEGLTRAGIHVTAPRRPATAGGSATATGHSWGSGRRLGN